MRLIQFPSGVEADRRKGKAVDLEHRVIVAELGDQEFRDIDLPRLHGAQRIRMLDKRGIRMHRDIESAIGGLLHIVNESPDIGGVIDAVRVRRGQIPFGLRRRSEGEGDAEYAADDVAGDSADCRLNQAATLHATSSVGWTDVARR